MLDLDVHMLRSVFFWASCLLDLHFLMFGFAFWGIIGHLNIEFVISYV